MYFNRVAAVIICVIIVLLIFFAGCNSKSDDKVSVSMSPTSTPANGNQQNNPINSGSGQSNTGTANPSIGGAATGGSEIPYKVKSDPFSGTCFEFIDYALNTGVTNINGDTKPDTLGITEFDTFNMDDTVIKKEETKASTYTESEDRFFCPCSGTYYQDVGSCNANCEVTLGCFSNICVNEGGRERTCYKGDVNFKISPKVKVDAVVTVLDWVPNGEVSNECKKIISGLRDRIMNHEKKHLAQMQDAISQAMDRINGATYNTGELSACGDTDEEAKQAFIQEVRDYTNNFAKHEVNRIHDDYKEKAKEFNENNHIEVEAALDCFVCESEQ